MIRTATLLLALSATLAGAAACARRTPTPDEHADHMRAEASGSVGSAAAAGAQSSALPAGAADAQARLAASPRHGEWAMIPAGAGDSVRAWVVYPQRRD